MAMVKEKENSEFKSVELCLKNQPSVTSYSCGRIDKYVHMMLMKIIFINTHEILYTKKKKRFSIK